MEIKRSQRKFSKRIASKRIWNSRGKRCLVALLYTFLILAIGAYLYKVRSHIKVSISPNLNISVPIRLIRGLLADPENITIDMKHEDFMKLAYQRELAVAKSLLEVGEDDYVPATVRYRDKTVKAGIRLKGDYVDHFNTDKWSFRIKVKGDNTLFGMKQFSIQHPKTRNYIYEWIYHHALRREGVISLRYDFIKVILNGKDMGVYALEEHFEKRLIEYNRLREGPIVKFNENLMWAERYQQRRPFPGAKTNGNSSYFAADIDTFQTNEMLSDSSSYVRHIQAINLLESFRRGELQTSDVFDIQKLARFFAINDLMGAQHGTNWHNFRFYYNPITSHLEPIGFDGDSGQPIRALSAAIGPEVGFVFIETIFNDLPFFQEYVKTLERISEPSYLDALLTTLNDELEQKLNIIYGDFPFYSFSKDVLYRNQRYIETVLNPVKGLHAYFHQSSDRQVEIELGNIQSMPVKVLSVSYRDSVLFQPASEILLPKTQVLREEPVDYRIARFNFPVDFVWSDTMRKDLKVNYRLLGTGRVRHETIFPWPHLDDRFAQNDFVRQESNLQDFDFISIDESARQILIKPGSWEVDQNLIIPGGYRVIALGETQLNLSNSAKILSYSPLQFIGSEDHSIVIQSTDSTGQGLVVVSSKETSVLEYVVFKNLSNPAQGGWELTGAVTFYEAPSRTSHCQFVGSRSEDALNIVRSEFTIEKTLFSQGLSDALDADFAKGKIVSCSFLGMGNDGIDASGSVIEVRDVFINGSGDKGMSAGERSQIIAVGMDIKNAQVAVASKDMSEVSIRNLTISDCKIGLAAYQNKPEFGAASMRLDGLKMERTKIPYLVEELSTLFVDNKPIEADRENVKEILYGVEYPKTSE